MNRQTHIHLKLTVWLSLLLFVVGASTTQAQTTAFTYQGRLNDSGSPATGAYDLQFRLFDALVSGNQVGSTLVRDNVPVASGIFSVTLDFGAAGFPGANRFLEIGVRPGSSTGVFTTLSPLQPITATPYALQSLNATNAANANNATNATQLGGAAASQYVVISDSRLTDSRAPTAGSTNYIQNTTPGSGITGFNINGSGLIGGSLEVLGNVGINTFTPLAKLDTRGDVFVGLTAVPDNATAPGNNIYVADDGGGDSRNSYRIDSYNNNLYFVARSGNASGNASSAGTGIVFRTATAGGGEVDRVTITPNGNITQGASNHGLAKAMLMILGNGTIGSCYNGYTNNSIGNCGFTVTRTSLGNYTIDFGQPVGGFASITVNDGRGIGASYAFNVNGTVRVGTYLTSDPNGSNVDWPFTIIMF